MKKDAYYFPHFSNARTDSKILKLRRVLGIEGYGIYFMLLEVLREQTDFMLPLSAIEDLEFEFRVSKEKINTVISSYDLFEIVDGKFFSPKLIYFLQPYLEKTVRARYAAQIRWNNANADANADANVMQGKESKVKERKLKESKVKEIKDPFGFGGLDLWEGWKLYKKEEHRESYKSEKTEQAAINQLYQLSGGDLAAAKKIIEQSIANRWKGLFQLKNTNNGTSKAEQLTADVQEAFNRRFGQV